MADEHDHLAHDHDEDDDDDHDHGPKKRGPLPGMLLWPTLIIMEPLNETSWVRAGEANHMLADDFIMGFSAAGESFAVPWWVLKNHHAANLRFGAESIVITFCENCSSASAFDPHLDSQHLTFKVVGTYNGTIIVADYQTGSYWAPFTGEALDGPLTGAQLTPLPLYQCTWDEWRALFPDSLVASGEGEPRTGHGSKQRPGSLEGRFARGARTRDRRLKRNALVLGVANGGEARAYAVDALTVAGPAVNDTLGGEPIVVFSQPDSLLAIAFSRRLDGRELHFEGAGPGRFRDAETGSEWDMQGRALSGPLSGQSLAFVPSAIEEWYAFATARKNVSVFEAAAK